MKILLYKKDERGLFMFYKNSSVEFVVAHLLDPNAEVGDQVAGWQWDHYFTSLPDAMKFWAMEEMVKRAKKLIKEGEII